MYLLEKIKNALIMTIISAFNDDKRNFNVHAMAVMISYENLLLMLQKMILDFVFGVYVKLKR